MNEPQPSFVDFRCPHCGKDISFPANWTGSVQQCLWCSQDLVVPQGSKEPAREIHLEIQMPRLFFRHLNEKDRSDLLEIMSDSDSLRYLDWQTMNTEDVEKWLAGDAKRRLIQLGYYVYFAVESKEHSKLIALASFHYYDEEWRQARFDIVVNRAFRRQGYGTEAVHGVLAFAFQEMNLRRVTATCDSRNVSGLKMLEKAGMRREGEFLESRMVKDEWINPVHHAMLRREWRNGE
jgi:RimJ/RimL family protein N-acetyltransferase